MKGLVPFNRTYMQGGQARISEQLRRAGTIIRGKKNVCNRSRFGEEVFENRKFLKIGKNQKILKCGKIEGFDEFVKNHEILKTVKMCTKFSPLKNVK